MDAITTTTRTANVWGWGGGFVWGWGGGIIER